jgi:hypothetical protein
MCSLRISGNPACSDYVALELDRRRRDTHLRLTRFDREEILNFYGISRADIEEFVMELRAELRTYEESLGSVGNASTCFHNKTCTKDLNHILCRAIFHHVHFCCTILW